MTLLHDTWHYYMTHYIITWHLHDTVTWHMTLLHDTGLCYMTLLHDIVVSVILSCIACTYDYILSTLNIILTEQMNDHWMSLCLACLHLSLLQIKLKFRKITSLKAWCSNLRRKIFYRFELNQVLRNLCRYNLNEDMKLSWITTLLFVHG